MCGHGTQVLQIWTARYLLPCEYVPLPYVQALVASPDGIHSQAYRKFGPKKIMPAEAYEALTLKGKGQ